MAALNFPSSPALDQTYTANGLTWRWNGVSWVTQDTANELTIAIGTVAPTSPANGNMWWKTDEGRLKIYYADGDTSQWVDAYPALAGPNQITVNTLSGITGLLKGASGYAAQAVAGTDYVAPGGALGTPSSGTLTNATGLPIDSGTTGTLTVARGGTGATTLTGLVKGNGTSAFTAAAAGTDYVAPGGALGTPSSGTLTNCTGYPRQTGDRDLLTTLTASNSAALQDAAILSTAGYVAFEIEFINLVPVTTGVNLHMRVYSGGAYQSTTYASSGIIPSNYFVYGQSGGGAPSGAYVAQGLLTWINTSVSNNSTMGGLCGRIKVDNPSGTSQYKTFYGHTDCSSHSWVGARMPTLVGFSWNGGAGAVAGFQVYFSSGNISTGSIKVWGLK